MTSSDGTYDVDIRFDCGRAPNCVPHHVLHAVWREAALRSGDDAFGIHVAEQIRPGAFDVLDYAIRASSTFGEALERLCRYHRILHDDAAVRLRVESDRVRPLRQPGPLCGLTRTFGRNHGWRPRVVRPDEGNAFPTAAGWAFMPAMETFPATPDTSIRSCVACSRPCSITG
ncbi:MAG: AraC family transcriptional regulator ligand-binding domain-containing protein, partial [Candidatus Binatia bacterium]